MNRANLGNIITNGVQTLSVSAFTGSNYMRNAQRQALADAASGLNNLTMEEARQVGQTRARQMTDEAERYSTGGTSPFQHLTNEEARKFRESQAQSIRESLSDNDEENDEITVDEIMEGVKSSNSPQTENLITKIRNDYDWLNQRKIYTREGSKFVGTTIEDIIKSRSEEEE